MLLDEHLYLVDWETLRVAPAERDLREVDAGSPAGTELFDLDWRLAEIAECS